MRRPNAVLVKDGDSELYLAFGSKEEREQWIVESLSQSILDLKVWRTSCDFLIPLPNSKFNTKTYIREGSWELNTKTYIREGSWGFNTKTYIREGYWGFNAKTYIREGSWGFNTKTCITWKLHGGPPATSSSPYLYTRQQVLRRLSLCSFCASSKGQWS